MDDGEYQGPDEPPARGLPPVVRYPATDPGDAFMLPVERPPLILGGAPEPAGGGSNRRRTVLIAGVVVLAAVAAVTTVVVTGGGRNPQQRTALSTRQSDQPVLGASFPDGPTGNPPSSATTASTASPTQVPATTPVAAGGTVAASTTVAAPPPGTPGPGSTSTTPVLTTKPAPSAAPPSNAPPAPTPAYAGRLASTAAATSTSSVSVRPSSSAAGGDTLLLAVMLTNTHSGSVSASDSAGNSYRVVVDQTDGAGDRTLVLAAPAIRALSSGGTVTLTFPTTGEYHVALDAFSGVSTVEGHSSATGAAGTPFASGSASLPGRGIVYGVAGVQGGHNAAWTSGLTALPTLFVSEDQLATGYLVASSSGGYQAGGSCQHQWMAGVVTLG